MGRWRADAEFHRVQTLLFSRLRTAALGASCDKTIPDVVVSLTVEDVSEDEEVVRELSLSDEVVASLPSVCGDTNGDVAAASAGQSLSALPEPIGHVLTKHEPLPSAHQEGQVGEHVVVSSAADDATPVQGATCDEQCPAAQSGQVAPSCVAATEGPPKSKIPQATKPAPDGTLSPPTGGGSPVAGGFSESSAASNAIGTNAVQASLATAATIAGPVGRADAAAVVAPSRKAMETDGDVGGTGAGNGQINVCAGPVSAQNSTQARAAAVADGVAAAGVVSTGKPTTARESQQDAASTPTPPPRQAFATQPAQEPLPGPSRCAADANPDAAPMDEGDANKAGTSFEDDLETVSLLDVSSTHAASDSWPVRSPIAKSTPVTVVALADEMPDSAAAVEPRRAAASETSAAAVDVCTSDTEFDVECASGTVSSEDMFDVPAATTRTLRRIKPTKVSAVLDGGGSGMEWQQMVQCEPFSASRTPQPFKVLVENNAMFIMDLHSHLAKTEIIGYVSMSSSKPCVDHLHYPPPPPSSSSTSTLFPNFSARLTASGSASYQVSRWHLGCP